MRMVYFGILALFGLFSTLHVVQAFLRFEDISTTSLGFAGAGLFGIALALINLLFLLNRSRDWITMVKAVASNAVGVVYFYLLSQSTGSWVDWGICLAAGVSLVLSAIVVQQQRNATKGNVV